MKFDHVLEISDYVKNFETVKMFGLEDKCNEGVFSLARSLHIGYLEAVKNNNEERQALIQGFYDSLYDFAENKREYVSGLDSFLRQIVDEEYKLLKKNSDNVSKDYLKNLIVSFNFLTVLDHESALENSKENFNGYYTKISAFLKDLLSYTNDFKRTAELYVLGKKSDLRLKNTFLDKEMPMLGESYSEIITRIFDKNSVYLDVNALIKMKNAVVNVKEGTSLLESLYD